MIKRFVRKAAAMAGVSAIRVKSTSDMALLYRLAPFRNHLFSLDADTRSFLAFCADRISRSHSQIMQDLFVLYALDGKQGGYFVDFGATDGVELSNSMMLERDHGWSGIVAEPARGWHAALRKNRACALELDCVSDRTGETIAFYETPGLGLSTFESLTGGDRHADLRTGGHRYTVNTISLNDMLAKHGAPHDFDYLSIDTEGSELSILSAFDLSRYRPAVITVEHNFVDDRRAAIHNLLVAAGYTRRFEQISMFDDWYVRADRHR